MIAHRVATLHELQTIYTLKDAEDMKEAIYMKRFNEAYIRQQEKKNAERQKLLRGRR